MFAPRVPLKTLALLARDLGTMLEAGVPVKRAIELISKKANHGRTREALRDVLQQVTEGTEISTALRSHGEFFPTLFIDMTSVGEETGSLPEVLTHLAEHYENNQRLRNETISSLAWPAIQLFLAVFVIAFLILVLGWIASSGAGGDLTHLTFGLAGPTGAGIWLLCTFGSLAGLVFAWMAIRRALSAKQIVDPILMAVPVVGHCMTSFAIARFSWAYFLTQQSGMPVSRSLEASLRATDHGAFINATGELCAAIQEGATVTEAFTQTRLFPEDYLAMVSVAEESGTVPEALRRLSPQFEESARRSLKALTRTISVLVWLALASFVIFFVFRFMLWYVGMINDAVSGKL